MGCWGGKKGWRGLGLSLLRSNGIIMNGKVLYAS